MSKDKKGKLLALIHSMSSHEKRYFKVHYVKQIGKGKHNVYILLFDAINKHKLHTNEQLRRHFEGSNIGKHLLQHKRYLYNLLLDALVQYNKDKNLRILNAIQRLQILFGKGLYEQAAEMVNAILQKYDKNDNLYLHAYLLEIRVHVDTMLSNIPQTNIFTIVQEAQNSLQAIQQILSLRQSRYALQRNRHLKYKSVLPNTIDSTLFDNPLLTKPIEQMLSVEAKVQYLLLTLAKQTHDSHQTKANILAQTLHVLLDSKNEILKQKYLLGVFGELLMQYVYLKQGTQFDQIWQMISQEQVCNTQSNSITYQMTLYYRLLEFSVYNRAPQKVERVLPDIKKFIDKYYQYPKLKGGVLHIETFLFFHYFLAQQYDSFVEYYLVNNTLYQNYTAQAYYVVYVLLMISYIETANYNRYMAQYRALKRVLKTQKLLSPNNLTWLQQLLNHLITLFDALSIQNQQYIKESYANLYHFLTQVVAPANWDLVFIWLETKGYTIVVAPEIIEEAKKISNFSSSLRFSIFRTQS